MPVFYRLNFLSAFLTAYLFPDYILGMLAPGVSTSGRRRERSIHQMNLQNSVPGVDSRRWKKEGRVRLWPEASDWLLRCYGCLIHGREFLVSSWWFDCLHSGWRKSGPPGKKPSADLFPSLKKELPATLLSRCLLVEYGSGRRRESFH